MKVTCRTTHLTSFGVLSNTEDAQPVRKFISICMSPAYENQPCECKLHEVVATLFNISSSEGG